MNSELYPLDSWVLEEGEKEWMTINQNLSSHTCSVIGFEGYKVSIPVFIASSLVSSSRAG